MWSRCAQYLRKMGGMILVASLVIWFLGYFPRQSEGESTAQHYENSYIGRIGKMCEPIFEPLGLNWKSGVALLSGVAAKEIMVSTMGVLYSGEKEHSSIKLIPSNNDISYAKAPKLHERLFASGDFSYASVLALLVFTLLYLPCVATIAAISSEAGWKWAMASIIYTTLVAWLCSFLVYRIALFF